MKGTLLGAAAMAALSIGAASAQEGSASRISELEKENAAIRKELALLRENRALQKQVAALKPVNAPAPRVAPPAAAGKSDPFAAYAADLPMAYKAPAVAQPRQFKVWGEGGAIWSGGDQILDPYNLVSFAIGIGGDFGGIPLGGSNGIFDLSPKVGWEAALGFDYRFTNSLWHVSGQFRYGASGKASGAAAIGGPIDPAIFSDGDPTNFAFINSNDAVATSYREKHWIADLMVGRDMLGSGSDTMQLKGGLRIAQIIGTRETSGTTSSTIGFIEPEDVLGVETSFISLAGTTSTTTRSSFLGAGPVVGIDGSIPLTGAWSLDYLGNAGVLFGTQKSTTSSSSAFTASPAVLALLLGSTNGASVSTSERFATMFSADLQAGVSYALTQNVKLGLSYRMDALINVQNQDSTAVTNYTPDRITHGPRVRITGQF